MANKTYVAFVDKQGGTTATNYIGNEGELFYDPSTTTLRVSDGVTPGGSVVSGGGGGNPFDQDLDTTDNVEFNEITVTSNTTANSYKLNTSAGVDVGVGEIAWNSADGTVDIGLNYGGVVLQVGQETHYVVRNATGSTIENGTAVYCSGVTVGSGRIEISKMESTVDPVLFLGLATQDITNGVNGVVTWFGYVRGLDTRGTEETALSVGDEDWAVGDKLYVHPTAPGKLTNVEPEAPNVKICVASVINRHQSAGVLFVRPTTNLRLSKHSDVEIDTPTNGQVLQYVSANNRWENTSDISVSGEITVGGDVILDGNIVGVYRIQPENNSMAEITIPADADANTNPLTIYSEGTAGIEITGGLILTPAAVTGDSTPANATIPTTQSVVMLAIADPSAAQFYLPDGTEGQILHLIPTSTATGDAALISLTIDNYRFINGGGTAVIESTSVSGNTFYPFSAGYTTAMVTMVFANGAWSASQGQWT
jgi:hypothetical protein